MEEYRHALNFHLHSLIPYQVVIEKISLQIVFPKNVKNFHKFFHRIQKTKNLGKKNFFFQNVFD